MNDEESHDMADGENYGTGKKLLGQEKGKAKRGEEKFLARRSDTSFEGAAAPKKQKLSSTSNRSSASKSQPREYTSSNQPIASTSNHIFSSDQSKTSASLRPVLEAVGMETDQDDAELQEAIRRSLEEKDAKGVKSKRRLKIKNQSKEANGSGKEKEVEVPKGWPERIDEFISKSDEFEATVEAGKGKKDIDALLDTVNFIQAGQWRDQLDRNDSFVKYLQRPSSDRLVGFFLALSREGVQIRMEDWEDVVVRCEREEEEGEFSGDESDEEEDESDCESDSEGMDDQQGEEQDPHSTSQNQLSLYLRTIRATVADHRIYSQRLIKLYPAYEPAERAFLHQIRNLDALLMIIRSYGGISGARRGWSRNEQDLKSSKKASSRFRAYVVTNGLEESIENYEVVLEGDEWLVGAGIGALRRHRMIQEAEVVLISMLSWRRLNQAFGGVVSRYASDSFSLNFSNDIRAVIDYDTPAIVESDPALSPTCSSTTKIPNLILNRPDLQTYIPSHSQAPPPLSTEQRQDLTPQKMEGMDLHLADARILLKNRKKCGPPISNAAFDRVEFGATTFEVSARGVIDTLCHGLKDITLEDFKYNLTGIAFHEASCGSGPAAEKRIQVLIQGLGAEHFVEPPLNLTKCEEEDTIKDEEEKPAVAVSPGEILEFPYPSPYSTSSRVICSEFGTYFNFWSLVIVHRDVWIAVIFWLRHLWTLGTHAIILSSAKLTKLLVYTNFVQLYQPHITSTCDHFDKFFNLCESDSINSVFEPSYPFENWKDMPVKDFTAVW